MPGIHRRASTIKKRRNSREVLEPLGTTSVGGQHERTERRRWLLASVIILALGIYAGFDGVAVKDPGSLEQPSLGFTLFGFRPPAGVSVFMGVQVPSPSITGCSRWANITLSIKPTRDFGIREWERLRTISKRLQFALMIVTPLVKNFKQETSDIYKSARPKLLTDHEPIDKDRGFAVFWGHDPFGANRWSRSIAWQVTFDASIVSERSVGSCWVHLPQLIGANAFNATSAAAAIFKHHGPWMFVANAGPGTQDSLPLLPARDFLVSEGRAALAGTDIDVGDSRPAPTNGVDEWACGKATTSPSVGCGAVVAVTAPWQGPFRDAMLLVAGVLLSVSAEMFFRAIKAP
jgi:hypothetical protein